MASRRTIVAAILSVALEVRSAHAFAPNTFQPLLRSSTATKTCNLAAKFPAASLRPTQLRQARSAIPLRMMSTVTENPLLALDTFPQFNSIKAEQVVPGFTKIIQDCDDKLAALEADLEKKDYVVEINSFLSTLEALSDDFGRSWGAVNHLKSVKDTEELRNAVQETQPSVVTFSTKMSQSEAIYKAFKKVKEGKDFASLTLAQKRIVESNLLEAELSGIALEGAKKDRFNEIQQELAKLSTEFSNNMMDCTKAYSLKLTKKEEVAGLPESALGLAAQTAVSKGDNVAPFRSSRAFAKLCSALTHVAPLPRMPRLRTARGCSRWTCRPTSRCSSMLRTVAFARRCMRPGTSS